MSPTPRVTHGAIFTIKLIPHGVFRASIPQPQIDDNDTNSYSWFENDYLAEVTIAFSDRKVRAHKIVRMNQSSYFRRMFSGSAVGVPLLVHRVGIHISANASFPRRQTKTKSHCLSLIHI